MVSIRLLALAAVCVLLALARAGVADVHRFDDGWRATASKAFTQAEVRSFSERIPLKEICDTRPEDVGSDVDCDTVGDRDFRVQVPEERLVFKLLEVAQLEISPTSAAGNAQMQAVFVDRSDGKDEHSSMTAPLVLVSDNTYRLRDPSDGLLQWFMMRLPALDGGLVALERVDGVRSDARIAFVIEGED